MQFNFKKILPDVYCVALFAVIAWAYFMSPVSKGYRLEQHDSGANDESMLTVMHMMGKHPVG